MKKRKTVFIVVLTVIAAVAGAAAGVYHFYIVPKYIEPVLETAAYILNDSSVKDEISKIADELSRQGLLDEETVTEFIESVRQEEASKAEEAPVPSETPQDNPKSGEPPSEETGAAETGAEETAKRKYSYGKSGNSEENKPVQATAKPQTSTTDSLYERVKSQVSAEDLKRGYEFLGKLDLSTIKSLMSDRAALKKYIRNSLTEDEYAELIGLYIKYSYLLKQ